MWNAFYYFKILLYLLHSNRVFSSCEADQNKKGVKPFLLLSLFVSFLSLFVAALFLGSEKAVGCLPFCTCTDTYSRGTKWVKTQILQEMVIPLLCQFIYLRLLLLYFISGRTCRLERSVMKTWCSSSESLLRDFIWNYVQCLAFYTYLGLQINFQFFHSIF